MDMGALSTPPPLDELCPYVYNDLFWEVPRSRVVLSSLGLDELNLIRKRLGSVLFYELDSYVP